MCRDGRVRGPAPAMADTPWSWSPVANSRWMTMSCRSRAIRSRSEITASSWRSARACVRSSHRATWSANPANRSRSCASSRPESGWATATSAVTGARWERSGTTTSGPPSTWVVTTRLRSGPVPRRASRAPTPSSASGATLTVSCSGPSDDHSATALRPGDLACGGHDLVQGRGQVDRRLEQLGELGGGLEPLATALAQREGARVADDVAGGARELLDERLVVRGERAAAVPSR